MWADFSLILFTLKQICILTNKCLTLNKDCVLVGLLSIHFIALETLLFNVKGWVFHLFLFVCW